jgi:hypothetical protein
MHISPAIRRRVIWGAIIGVFLIVIIVAILTYADSYALTEGAKRRSSGNQSGRYISVARWLLMKAWPAVY